jgi:hypothetical protein
VTRAKTSKGGAFTDEDRAELRRLHADGLSRNEIARQMRRSSRTISVYAAEEHLSFDRTMTEEATRARKADLEERRVILAEALQGDAEKLTEQLWQPHWVFNFGGKDNTYERRLLDQPPAEAQKALMSAAGIAIDRSLKLLPPDREDLEGLAAVDAWLRGMMPGAE